MAVLLILIPILISIAALIYFLRAARHSKQVLKARQIKERGQKEARIDRVVDWFRGLHLTRSDGGMSAFLKCDIGGMSPEDLEEAASRIKHANCGDPFKEIRTPLKEAGISIGDYFKYMGEKGYTFQERALHNVIEEIKSIKGG